MDNLEKKNKINLVLATGIYPPDIGGPATYVHNLREKLPAFGFNVRVVSYGNEARDSEDIVIIDRRQNIIFRYAQYFAALWRMRKWVDLVYVQGPVSEGVPVALFCKIFKKKYVLKVVGDYAWEQGRQRFGVRDLLDDFVEKYHGLTVGFFRLAQYWVARGAKLIITPSEYLKSIVVKWRIPSDKIKVVYNSVREVEQLPDKKSLRDKFGLTGDVIMSGGRLVSWKGFFTLITLMPELIKENPNFRLIIVGYGPDQQKLESRIADLKLKKFVQIIVGKNKTETLMYMRAADMFVLNTGYEGLSHMLIEAAQVGVPIITTRVGGNAEVIKDGISGVLVNYDDKESIKSAILDLWRDKGKAEEFAVQAHRGLLKFSEKKMVTDIVDVLRSCIN